MYIYENVNCLCILLICLQIHKIYKPFELLHYWIQIPIIFPNIDWLDLTSTVHVYWVYLIVPFIDFHCTPFTLQNISTDSTVPHCTALLSSIVSNCKPMYRALTSTVPLMYVTVQSYWSPLYPTVRYCTGHWPALYGTVQALTSTVPHCTTMYMVVSSTVTHCTPLYHKLEW